MRDYKLPEVLRELLKERKMSQNKLADKMDIGQRSVYEWVSGKTLPSLYSLMGLEKEFNVSLDYLVYGGEEDTKK